MPKALILVATLICVAIGVEVRADDAILQEIKAGWRQAFDAAKRITSMECKVETIELDKTSWVDRYSIRTKGDKLFFGTSSTGTDFASDKPFSMIRIFNGKYQAFAQLPTVFDTEFSEAAGWTMSAFEVRSEPNWMLRGSAAFIYDAGVRISCSGGLGYFDFDKDHWRVDKLEKVNERGQELWKLHWTVLHEKTRSQPQINPSNFGQGIFWLDPEQSYLPVRSELFDDSKYLMVEEYHYRPNWGSFYAWKIKMTYYPDREKGDFRTIETNVDFVSDQPVPDEVFKLAYYGLAEPEIVKPVRTFPWYLIVIGLAMIVVGVVVRRQLNRNQ